MTISEEINATINKLILASSLNFPKKAAKTFSHYFFHGAFAPSFIWCRRLCLYPPAIGLDSGESRTKSRPPRVFVHFGFFW